MQTVCRYYKDDDIMWIILNDVCIRGGKPMSGGRHLDLDVGGNICGIIFEDVTNGVDLTGIPEEHLPVIKHCLAGNQIEIHPHIDIVDINSCG